MVRAGLSAERQFCQARRATPEPAGDIAAAGLDVYEHEPAINPKLLTLPNVVLLPHMGSATVEARGDMGDKVIVNIRTYMDGHRPPDRVIPAML